jgi:hypothetical protein
MTSSAARQAVMIPHPARQAARPASFNLTLNAKFRVFDPDDEDMPASTERFRPLEGVTVEVFVDDDLVLTAETGTGGYLQRPGISPSIPPVIQNADAYFDRTLHFRVLNPAWSTRDWKEPEGHLGSFRIGSDGTTSLGLVRRPFTVGCFIIAKLQFKRSDGKIAPFPDNIELYSFADDQLGSASRMTLREDGELRGNIFNAVAGRPIEVKAKLCASSVPQDHTDTATPIPVINPVTGDAAIMGDPLIEYVPGARFGLDRIAVASTIELYKDVVGSSVLPGAVEGDGTRLNYSEYPSQAALTYFNLSAAQKEAIFLNWFVEFVAFRTLFVRTMSYLLKRSSKMTWAGLDSLTLHMIDGPGGAFTEGQVITVYLGEILKVRDHVFSHELTHAFFNQYIPGRLPTKNYYPAPETTDHVFGSYSNEFFAFSEGIAEFMGTLFVNTDRAYDLPERPPENPYQVGEIEDWEKLINSETNLETSFEASSLEIRIGFEGVDIDLPNREAWIGLVVEGAFAIVLTKLWNYIWDSRSDKHIGQTRWVQPKKGDGTLSFGSNDPNSWLKEELVQKAFAFFIIDPIFEAFEPIDGGRVGQRISTRRVVDRIEKRAGWPVGWPNRPLADATWAVIAPFFANRRAINGFYISTIETLGGPECPVVRREADHVDYRLPEGDAFPFALAIGVPNTILLRGIRIPAALSVKLLSAGVVLSQAAVVVSTEYEASATFADLGTTLHGVYDLLFECLPVPPGMTLLLKDIKVE